MKRNLELDEEGVVAIGTLPKQGSPEGLRNFSAKEARIASLKAPIHVSVGAPSVTATRNVISD